MGRKCGFCNGTGELPSKSVEKRLAIQARPKILRNAAKCNHCGVTIESTHVHDFVSCDCKDEDKSVFVDGGLDYFRIGCGVNADYESLSEVE